VLSSKGSKELAQVKTNRKNEKEKEQQCYVSHLCSLLDM
jgi:hypothetical protein